MLLVDTDVFVYAAGGVHPLQAPAERLLRAAVEGRVEITTTPGVVQEFLHVYASRRGRHEAAARAHDIRSMCEPFPPLEQAAVPLAVELFRRYPRLDASDCLLAAATLDEGVTGLVSADRAFGEVTGLHWIDLWDPDVEKLTDR